MTRRITLGADTPQIAGEALGRRKTERVEKLLRRLLDVPPPDGTYTPQDKKEDSHGSDILD